MIRIKVCGITRLEDAKVASNFGVDALGFIFYEKSKRYILPENAASIVLNTPPFITPIAVFVNESIENILRIASITGITTVQLHGDETPEFCRQLPLKVVKAFGVGEKFNIKIIKSYSGISGFLLDSYNETQAGGTGRTIDWSVAAQTNIFGNLILAGGLGPSNLLSALETVEPYGVDLNSGVEIMPGQKNPVKIKQCVDIVRNFRKGI